jgi:hypothetical protein
VNPVQLMHSTKGVSGSDDGKTYIDVMENVFGGVRISSDDEPRSLAFRKDLRRWPWLTGVTMSSVHVTVTDDDENDEDEDRDL